MIIIFTSLYGLLWAGNRKIKDIENVLIEESLSIE